MESRDEQLSPGRNDMINDTSTLCNDLVIAIAMKLPVDLNNPMPGVGDQFAKMGSMVLMCAMISNFMPSLASMGNKELFANMIGLVILTITMIVNVLIQIITGLMQLWLLYIYFSVAVTLSLLIISISSAVATPTLKQVLEFKYQATHKSDSNHNNPQHTRMFTVEELKQLVRRYWVMAATCNPQFVMVSTPLCSAVGIICGTNAIIFLIMAAFLLMNNDSEEYDSDYKWSMAMIRVTQYIGIVVAIIAPICRCFAALSFKLSIKWSKKHIKVFTVDKYWIQKLSEWKQSQLALPLGGRRSKVLFYNLRNLILNICIGCQKVIVVSCKIIGLFPICIVIFVVYCLHLWKSLKTTLFAMPIASSGHTIPQIKENDMNKDISNYVLQLQDGMEIGTRTLKRISNLVNRVIQKAENQHPNKLLKLLEKSKGFEGLKNLNFEHHQVQPLKSWSLTVVTLTSIAIALPDIHEDIVDSLLRSVGECLWYTFLVEESLNSADESICIQRATKNLWYEVEVNNKWLGNTLEKDAYKGKTSIEILEWFAKKAEEIVAIKRSPNRELLENFRDKLVVANSMYRIAWAVIINYQINEQSSDLFGMLSGIIADIVVACLTNLPRVIAMKCHESVIEKREAGVESAAKLLGRSKEIIERPKDYDLPSLDPDQMASPDGWYGCLNPSIPWTSLLGVN